jgi:hypothetical protein
MTHRGFTLTMTPHGGGRRRSWSLRGWRLHLLRAGLVLAALLVVAGAVVLAVGMGGVARADRLEDRVATLRDSLALYSDLATRLDSIESELARIREIRGRIENLAGVATPPGADTL